MLRKILIACAVSCAVVGPASAQSVDDLYNDAVDQAEKGASFLESADWQFRIGNPQEGCRIMEQARVHYEQAYNDVNTMNQIVNDDANGFSGADRDRLNAWIRQQTDTMNDIGGRMAGTYRDVCQKL